MIAGNYSLGGDIILVQPRQHLNCAVISLPILNVTTKQNLPHIGFIQDKTTSSRASVYRTLTNTRIKAILIFSF